MSAANKHEEEWMDLSCMKLPCTLQIRKCTGRATIYLVIDTLIANILVITLMRAVPCRPSVAQ